MISRRVILAAGMTLPFAPAATARENPFLKPVPFDGLFERDIAGGSFELGEDRKASASFRKNPKGVVAEFQILEPHRTERYSSGVSLWGVDAARSTGVHVAFEDHAFAWNVVATVCRPDVFGEHSEASIGIVSRKLSTLRNAVGRVSIRAEGDRRVVFKLDGESIPVDLNFQPHALVVQIFCAKGWMRFPEGNLVS